MLRTILVLGRVSNLPTVWTNVLVGWFLAGGEWDWRLSGLIVGVSLLYVAGMTLNDAFDAEWDRKHAPERPIPSGAISERAVWLLGACQMILGAGFVVFLSPASWPWLTALTAAILLYDWVHKKTAWAVLLMGACRALVYLLAAVAAKGVWELSTGILFWSTGMGIFVIGITMAAKGERTGGKVRWLALLPLAAPVFGAWAVSSFWSMAMAVSGWGVITLVIRLHSKRKDEFSVGNSIAVLIASICYFDAISLLGAPEIGAFFASFGCLILTRILQRRIPAT